MAGLSGRVRSRTLSHHRCLAFHRAVAEEGPGCTLGAVKTRKAWLDRSKYLSAKVIEQTELKGQWEIHLQWDVGQPRIDGAQPSEFGSLFTALQEQLGLKLEARRLPVEVLVIDNVERPREN
jgi:uncharacterized protein (TIGR03435 family)